MQLIQHLNIVIVRTFNSNFLVSLLGSDYVINMLKIPLVLCDGLIQVFRQDVGRSCKEILPARLHLLVVERFYRFIKWIMAPR